MYGRKIVRALVSAFNVHNYARNTVKTNFTLQSRGGEDYIVVSFDKGTKDYQCSEYLDSIKRKIIREFYGIEESNDKEILDTAKKDFDVTSFPFNYIYKGDWSVDKQGRIEFVAPVDQGVIFNLKSHLAASLAKGVLEDMRVSSTAVPFNKKKYLWCGEFDNKQLREEFEREFLSRMENRYGYRNGFKNPLKVKGNSVYIRDVFDDARFIDSVARYITWLKGMGLQADSKVRGDVKAFKELIMEFIDQPTEIIIAGFVCASPLGREEASVLIPLVLNGGRKRILTNEEALKLNHAFNGAVFNDLYGGTQGELAINGGNGLYSIDFSNPYISHCVITKIIESSVINKDHELAIDPELPRTLLTEPSPTREFPKRSRDEGLERPPRQGSEREGGKRGLFQLVPEEIDSSQSTCGQSQLSLSRSSSISSPRAWKNSMSLNSGVSSDECSEAKSQDSKSPKKHGGGVQKMKKWLSSTFSKQYDVNLKRHDEGRGTTRSTPETPVTKKSSVSRLFSSLSDIVRAENNSPSKETSPVSSLDGDPGPSQGTISGKGEVLPVEYRSDNSSSKTAVDRDSGFCSTGSPAAQHKGSVPSKESVPSEVKECEVEPVSEALRK